MKASDKNIHLAPATTNDPRWQQVLAHDTTADGHFYYSVRTTGVYCCPSCASRPPRPENVAFHATREGARQAGFRPCKRCRPELMPQRSDSLKTTHEVSDMTTSLSHAVGANNVIHFATGDSSLGIVLVAGSERGLCAVLMGGDANTLARNLQDRFPDAYLKEGGAALQPLLERVLCFIEAPASEPPDIPLDVRGTPFQQRVWHALGEIPSGTTASYKEIAGRIGSPASVRAVAQACAANALAVLIPCHRVVRNDGALSGYRWGIERKRALLDREARA